MRAFAVAVAALPLDAYEDGQFVVAAVERIISLFFIAFTFFDDVLVPTAFATFVVVAVAVSIVATTAAAAAAATATASTGQP